MDYQLEVNSYKEEFNCPDFITTQNTNSVTLRLYGEFKH